MPPSEPASPNISPAGSSPDPKAATVRSTFRGSSTSPVADEKGPIRTEGQATPCDDGAATAHLPGPPGPLCRMPKDGAAPVFNLGDGRWGRVRGGCTDAFRLGHRYDERRFPGELRFLWPTQWELRRHPVGSRLRLSAG